MTSRNGSTRSLEPRCWAAAGDAAEIVDRFRGGIRKVDTIVIAMPSAAGPQMHEAVANCKAAGVPYKTIPGVGELLSGAVLTSQIRSVSIADLLGRDPVELDVDRILSHVAGRSVLITGAAGSIGSELCRQVAALTPRTLVLFDQAESPMFWIDNELRRAFPELNIESEIGDIRDKQRLEAAIRSHRVDLVFHAAAYKHVPLMEDNVLEAVRNNVIGTWNVATAVNRISLPHCRI